MKFTIALFFICLAKVSFAEDDDPIHVVCQPSDENGQVYFVAHPYDCQKFFMCQGYVGIPMHCPANLQFDTTLNVCNYESVVQCENTPRPTPEPETTTPEQETTTMEDETTTIDEEDTTLPDDLDYW